MSNLLQKIRGKVADKLAEKRTGSTLAELEAARGELTEHQQVLDEIARETIAAMITTAHGKGELPDAVTVAHDLARVAPNLLGVIQRAESFEQIENLVLEIYRQQARPLLKAWLTDLIEAPPAPPQVTQ